MTLEELVKQYDGYAKILADYYQKAVLDYGIEYEDLYQVGVLGLIEGYKDYSSDKSSLNTYAYDITRYAILKYIHQNTTITHVPKTKKYLAATLMKKETEFYVKTGREMTYEEKIDVLNQTYFGNTREITTEFITILDMIKKYHFKGMEISTKENLKNFKSKKNLYDGYEEDINVDEILISDNDTAKEAIINYEVDKIIEYVNTLKEREKDIFLETMGLVDGISKTRQFLADKHNITRQGVDKSYKTTLEKVKKYRKII